MRRRRPASACQALAAVVLALAVSAAAAQTPKPRVPPGRDPGGIAVVLLTYGIDYTDAAVARRLARDGEGEVLGLDLVDNDNRPFAAARPSLAGIDGTALARLLAVDGVRIVPVRLKPDDPLSPARAVAFAAQTPARIVVVPMSAGTSAELGPLRQATGHFKELLVIVAAGAPTVPSSPLAVTPPNLLVVTGDGATKPGPDGPHLLLRASPPAASAEAAVLAAVALAACRPAMPEKDTGEALRRAFLATAAAPGPGALPAIERCVAQAAKPN